MALGTGDYGYECVEGWATRRTWPPIRTNSDSDGPRKCQQPVLELQPAAVRLGVEIDEAAVERFSVDRAGSEDGSAATSYL